MNENTKSLAYCLVGIVIGLTIVSGIPYLIKTDVAESGVNGTSETHSFEQTCEGDNVTSTDQCPALKERTTESKKASIFDVAFLIALALMPSTLVFFFIKYRVR